MTWRAPLSSQKPRRWIMDYWTNSTPIRVRPTWRRYEIRTQSWRARDGNGCSTSLDSNSGASRVWARARVCAEGPHADLGQRQDCIDRYGPFPTADLDGAVPVRRHVVLDLRGGGDL